jgi:hypothetical protein
MKKLYKIILLTCISTTSINMSKAQGLDDKFNINVSVGLHIIFNANINCEYRITDNSYISLGYGELTHLFEGQVSHIDLSHVFLKGRNNHYLEFAYGLTSIAEVEYSELAPNFRLGYRKINDFNSMFFRTGISYAEGLYIGFGRSF